MRLHSPPPTTQKKIYNTTPEHTPTPCPVNQKKNRNNSHHHICVIQVNSIAQIDLNSFVCRKIFIYHKKKIIYYYIIKFSYCFLIYSFEVETKDETSFMAPKEENSIVTPGSSTNTSSSTTAKLSSKPVKVSGSTNSSIVIKTTGVENQATSKNNTTTTLPKTDMKAMSTNIPKPQSTLPIDANTQKTGTETVKGEQHSGAGAATTITNKTNTNSTPSITRKSDTVSKTDSAIGTSDKYKSNDDVVDDKDLYPSKDDDNDYMPPPTNNEHEKSNSESNDKANNNNNQPVDSNTVTTIGHSDFGVGKEKIPNSGHFFAYFLTAIVICITGYVIFHNKQKVRISFD